MINQKEVTAILFGLFSAWIEENYEDSQNS
jgi:hypothetical protein